MVGTPNQIVDTGGEGSRHAKEEEESYWVWSACGSLEATDGYQQAKTHHAVVTVYSGRGLGSFNDYSGHKNEHDSISKYEHISWEAAIEVSM